MIQTSHWSHTPSQDRQYQPLIHSKGLNTTALATPSVIIFGRAGRSRPLAGINGEPGPGQFASGGNDGASTIGGDMSIYEEDPCRSDECIINFGSADPLDVLGAALIFVPFDSDRPGRRPVIERVPGHPGLWMLAYSTRHRLTHIYGDAIDYSEVAGHEFLAEFTDSAGIWLDYGYPSGRKITLPPRLVAAYRR